MIKPSIGRVVLVYRHPSKSDQFEPALITYVWSDTLINVGGFDMNGDPFKVEKIQLDQSNIAEEFPGYSSSGKSFACWMPYQIKAAR